MKSSGEDEYPSRSKRKFSGSDDSEFTPDVRLENDDDLPVKDRVVPKPAGYVLMDLFEGVAARSRRLKQSYVLKLASKFQDWPFGLEIYMAANPALAWTKICSGGQSWVKALGFHLLPMLVLAGIAEGVGQWVTGRQQIALGMTLTRLTPQRIIVYEILQAAGILMIMLVVGVCSKAFGNACHRRNRVGQSLLVLNYALCQYLLMQLFNGFTQVSVWLTWFLGSILAIRSLYHGLPRILKPDPPSALGLFVSTSVILAFLLFLSRFIFYEYLVGNFVLLDHLITWFSKSAF